MKSLIYLTYILFLFSCSGSRNEEDKSSQIQRELDIAHAYEAKGKYLKAISHLDKLLEMDPKHIQALMDRAVDKSLLEDYEGAIKDYSAVIAIDSLVPLAYLNRGKNYLRIEQFQRAKSDFDQAITIIQRNESLQSGEELQELNTELRFERGVAFYNLNNIDSAIIDITYCEQADFDYAYTNYFLGLIHLKKGDTVNSCDYFTKAWLIGGMNLGDSINNLCQIVPKGVILNPIK